MAAPSANSSGKPSPTLAKHVIEDLMGKVDVIIDGGNAEVGVESTVLDITVTPPVILRPGGVTLEQLQSVLGDVVGSPVPDTAEMPAPEIPGHEVLALSPKQMLLVEALQNRWRQR